MMDEDEIERLRHDGRVFRWSTSQASGSPGGSPGGSSGGWPGHTTFVALRGGEVVVGDRYAGEGVERTYACEPAALLDGCFQELVAQQLGPRVLEELLAEVRRELGLVVDGGVHVGVQAGAQVGARVGAQAPAPVIPPPMAVSAPPKPSEQPSTPVSEGSRVDVAVVACRVSLPLAVALRGLMRAPVQELLGRLRSLPCRVAAGVPREHAEGLAARLAELGAEVRLLPAGAS